MIHTSGSVAKSCLTLVTPWTVAHQALQSMEFSRQEYWSGLPFPSSGELHNPGIEPSSPVYPALLVDSLLLTYQEMCTIIFLALCLVPKPVSET